MPCSRSGRDAPLSWRGKHMGAYLSGLFASDGFLPHGLCLSWDPALIWLHVLADGLIAVSYYSIPAALLVFVLRREVDERKRAEQRAADAHARLIDAIEAIPGSFRLFDKDERLVIANARRWTGDTDRLPPLTPGARFEDFVRVAADRQLARASVG